MLRKLQLIIHRDGIDDYMVINSYNRCEAMFRIADHQVFDIHFIETSPRLCRDILEFVLESEKVL